MRSKAMTYREERDNELPEGAGCGWLAAAILAAGAVTAIFMLILVARFVWNVFIR